MKMPVTKLRTHFYITFMNFHVSAKLWGRKIRNLIKRVDRSTEDKVKGLLGLMIKHNKVQVVFLFEAEQKLYLPLSQANLYTIQSQVVFIQIKEKLLLISGLKNKKWFATLLLYSHLATCARWFTSYNGKAGSDQLQNYCIYCQLLENSNSQVTVLTPSAWSL